MREFLSNYVEMIAENHDTNITKDELNRIVEYLMEEEEVWNLIDSIIINKLDDKEVM